MTGVVRIACSDGSAPELNRVEVTWEDNGDGTLADSVGVTWTRP